MSLSLAIGGVSTLLGKALDFFSDDDKREAEILLAELASEQKRLENQSDINIKEASHRSLFVAGWRPFIGWVCGFALLFEFIVRPYLSWFASLYFTALPIPPSISDVLLELVFAMLGLGGLRTFEKYKSVSR